MAATFAFTALSVIPAADRNWKVTVPAELSRSILAMALFVKPPYLLNFLIRSCSRFTFIALPGVSANRHTCPA